MVGFIDNDNQYSDTVRRRAEKLFNNSTAAASSVLVLQDWDCPTWSYFY